MIDLRTLLVLLAVADVIFAAAVWLAGGRPLRDGLGAWSGSLLVRALACTLVAAGIPTPGAIAVGAGLLALSITLQASAILALQRRRLDAWLYGAIVAAVALPLQLLEADRAEAAIFGGWVIGSLLAGAGAVAWHSRPGHRASSRRALVASYLVAATVFAWRGLSA